RYESHIMVMKDVFGEWPGRRGHVLKMVAWGVVPAAPDTIRRTVTAFFDAGTNELGKLTVSESSAGGTRMVQAEPRGDQLVLRVDGRESRHVPWNGGTVSVFSDALPLWLRSLDLQKPAHYPVRMLPSQLSSSGTDAASGEIEVMGPAGRP